MPERAILINHDLVLNIAITILITFGIHGINEHRIRIKIINAHIKLMVLTTFVINTRRKIIGCGDILGLFHAFINRVVMSPGRIAQRIKLSIAQDILPTQELDNILIDNDLTRRQVIHAMIHIPPLDDADFT